MVISHAGPLRAPGILRRAVARNRRHLGLGTLLYCCHQICESLVPILIGVGIDRAVAPGDGRALLVWVAALAVLFGLLSMAYRFGGRHLMRAITDEAYYLRDELAAKILHPRGLRTPLRAGELLTVASTDADNVSYLLDYVPRIAGAVTATLICAVALVSFDWRLGVAVLAGTPVVLGVLQLAGPRIARRVEAQQDLAGRASSLATDLVAGIRPLRGIGAERAAARRYHAVSQASLGASLRAARTQGAYLAASTATSGLLACGVAVLAGWFALTGRISVGELIAVIGLAQFLMEPLAMLAAVPSWIAEARGSAERVALVVNAPHVVPEPTLAAAGDTTLEVADARHGSLDGLDLVLRPGEFVGLVAYRPADAEALVRLLAGRVAPEEFGGTVRLGGVHLQQLESARELLHVEPHHTDLFAGTLAANLAPEGAGPQQVDAALRAAAADEVVAAHPAGLEHAVDERGAGLSGGQRQRLALARALLARPPILVLHDPTTAIDAVTEQSVALGVRALRKDLTTLVVTSSPALLAVADRVVVVDAGRVHTTGTHASLGATDAGYARAVLR
ncbi:ABC transporter transmembrane domain-containing protein [Dactylosporangium sp. CS-033363]|uniref:ABC transporter transmembrane domain-containing protein n=1 Tax=Dactylosporangium sp. CS-033363 TaxID=3239935 RepID=UPI003D8BC023